MTTKTKAKPAAATADTAVPSTMTGAQIVVEALREQGVDGDVRLSGWRGASDL